MTYDYILSLLKWLRHVPVMPGIVGVTSVTDNKLFLPHLLPSFVNLGNIHPLVSRGAIYSAIIDVVSVFLFVC